MASDALLFFKAFYSVVAEIYVYGEYPPDYVPVLQAELAGLDLMAANEVVQKKLQNIHPDEQLLHLYEDISASQQQHLGDVYPIEEDDSLVIATAEVAKRIGGADGLSLDAFPKFVAALKQAFHDQHQASVLRRYIAVNQAALHEYRFQKLEEQIARTGIGHVKEEEAAMPGEFTHTQQAIAIHYLIHEVLGIAGVDNTRLMEFAHLLAAKKIPLHKETGKENLRNSGIKSAFNKAWNKEDANHLADLRFVLRFFKPLDVEGAGGMHQGVAALEKRIAKLSEKLSREKD